MGAGDKISISAGGSISISGAVGNDIRVNRTMILGDNAIDAISGQVRLIQGEIAKEAKLGHIPDHVAVKLVDEVSEIGKVIVDGAEDQAALKGRLTRFIDRINFVCTTADSVSLITRTLAALGAAVGVSM